MALTVAAIQQPDLAAAGRFLHENLARRITPEAWVTSLSQGWAVAQPNYGMQLHDGDQLVGVICAVYSDQQINGQIEHFCNPHSWCVKPEYRHASMSLLLPLVKQRGYHFTMFTPNPKVTQVFMGLRFRLLDDGLLYTANLPTLWPQRRGGFVEHRVAHIAARLRGVALGEFDAHRQIPWLRFVAFGVPGDACLVIYKPGRWKKLRCAEILHVSDAGAMARHGHLLRHHLLTARATPVSRVEARFVTQVPWPSLRSRRTQAKLVLSRTLADSQIRDVYSELMALDL